MFAANPDIQREDVDFVLFCTQSPDYFLPTSACLIQEQLGLRTNIGAIDYNLGCSGYVYGLAVAKGLIIGGIAKNVLLLTAETYSEVFTFRETRGTVPYSEMRLVRRLSRPMDLPK